MRLPQMWRCGSVLDQPGRCSWLAGWLLVYLEGRRAMGSVWEPGRETARMGCNEEW
jgi:hypothetical protein